MDSVLQKKIKNHKYNTTVNKGLENTLTVDDYCQMLAEASIEVSDWNRSGYHIARYKDLGHYHRNNCRFIHYTENAKELWTHLDSTRISDGVKKYISENGSTWDGRLHKDESKRKIGDQMKILQKGDLNSQYGTMWITDDVIEKKIKKNDGIPSGFRKGRLQHK